MTKISSKYLLFMKWGFPLLWFGFLGLFFVQAILTKSYVLLLVPGVMAVFGYFLMKKFVWNLVDEVYDCGDFLLIRNRGEEDRVLLSNVMNVSASLYMNPPRITLRLVNPGKFGEEVSFSPTTPFTLNPFAKNRVVDDLITRVDQARLKRRS